MNVKIKSLKNLFLTTTTIVALLAPSGALAGSNLSSSCPPSSSVSAQSFLQRDWVDSVFYQPLLAMQEEMNRMNRIMQEAFYATGNSNVAHEQLYSRVNMDTTPKEYRITMFAPGLDEKNLKVEVGADNTLTIRSEKNLVQKTSSGTEHSFGSFTQMLTLPPDADTAHLLTSYKDGEYTVTLPRNKIGSSSSGQTYVHDQSL